MSNQVPCPMCASYVEIYGNCCLCGNKRSISIELSAAFYLLLSAAPAGFLLIEEVEQLRDMFDE